MTNPTTSGFKSQLSAEWQKTKKTRDYDKIKSLHVDINAAKNKVKTMIAEKKAGETIVLPSFVAAQKRELEKKLLVGVARRRTKKGIVMKRSTYVPKWKKK